MKRVIYNEKEYDFCELIRIKGLEKHYQTIYQRIYNGKWDIEKAFDTAIKREDIKKPITDKQEEKLEDMIYQRKLLNASKLEPNRLDTRETRIINAIELLSENFKKIKAPEVEVKNHINLTSGSEYILCISDLHCGSKFNHFTNEYSYDILRERLDNIVKYIVENNISKLTVVSLGDLIQGMLRLSDIRLNESTVSESIVMCSQIISEFLCNLSLEVEEVEYISVPVGNHDYNRYFNDKGFVAETTVQIIDYAIKLACRDFKNIKVDIDSYRVEDTVQFKIMNSNVVAVHGHQVKRGGNPIVTYNDKYKNDFNLMLMGHYHSFEYKEVGKNQNVITCGSIIGECPYSRSLDVSASSSACLIEINDKGIGNIKNINLN